MCWRLVGTLGCGVAVVLSIPHPAGAEETPWNLLHEDMLVHGAIIARISYGGLAPLLLRTYGGQHHGMD
jgi:hypothetical protein